MNKPQVRNAQASKLLIHIGPHKTGSSQLQALFDSNSEVLSGKLITQMNPRLKEPIRSYLHACRTPGVREKSIFPWHLNCPRSYFEKLPYHDYGLLSEEAIFKLFRRKQALLSFDRFLSTLYDERVYLAVLREINGHAISQVSQAIKGARLFSYRQCRLILKRHSLDRVFAGVLDTDLSLEVATFGKLVANSQSAINVSSVLENIFGVSELKLNEIEGVRNKSLGAEGAAIRLAYNNIMRMILGENELAQCRIELRNSGRRLSMKIMDHFPEQRGFCPYTEEEQSMFNKRHLKKSKKFIRQFTGPWVNEVFTPVIREKSIAFVSEFSFPERQVATDLLESHITGFLGEMSLERKPVASSQVTEAIRGFLENEKQVVL